MNDWRVFPPCGCSIEGTGAKKTPYRIKYCIKHKLNTALLNTVGEMQEFLDNGTPIHPGSDLAVDLCRIVSLGRMK